MLRQVIETNQIYRLLTYPLPAGIAKFKKPKRLKLSLEHQIRSYHK